MIICDLKIPTTDGALDADVKYGQLVFEAARREAAGTPIRYLTAFATPEIISGPLSVATPLDIFGTNEPYPMAAWFGKSDLVPCIGCVGDFAEELKALEHIEIVHVNGDALTLGPDQKRVLRVFARRTGGVVIKIDPLSGGLSGAMTLRARIYDNHEAMTASVVAKIAPLREVEDEHFRYSHYVAPMLHAGSYAPFADEVKGGAYGYGGLYYRLAETHHRTLFDVLAEDEAAGEAVVHALREAQEPWREGVHSGQKTIRDLRRQVIPDEEMGRLVDDRIDFDWQQFEDKWIQVREMYQHGDLHGLNVLVDDHNRPLMIDYGDVGSARHPWIRRS